MIGVARAGWREARRLLPLLAGALLVAGGCAKRIPDYLRPLPPQGAGLRRITDPADLPDLRAAFAGRDQALLDAIDRSLAWFDAEPSRSTYPLAPLGVSHERARLSTLAFRELLRTCPDAEGFRERVAEEFDIYASVGWDGGGGVLFTGYYAPVFRASRVRTDKYRYPLYGRPPDLVVEEGTDRILGRAVDGKVVPYPSRAVIEEHPERLGLAGREVAWLSSKLDAYLVQVQGSAQLDLGDGSPPLHIGYAGSNGREYTSLGKLLAADGKIERSRLSIPAIRAYFREHPEELDSYLDRNERYIFFREIPDGEWPAGSLGFQLTPLRSLATDKTIYPRGCVVLVATELATPEGEWRPFEQFMLDQDTGGAIRAPGRADIYIGVGDPAGEIAGRQAHAGRLFYFLLKPGRLAFWKKNAEDRARPSPRPPSSLGLR